RPGAAAGSASSSAADSTACRRGVRSSSVASSHDSPLCVSPQALPVFCVDVLENPIVERELGDDLFEPPILVLELTQPLGVGGFQPSVLGFPAIERLLADTGLPAHLG